MDLSFSPEEQAFATEVRHWLTEALAETPPPARFDSLEEEISWGRRWQARLAEDRWVGIHWPAEYGGRGASPVEVALFNGEYARAGAPQPVNRVGINLAGPTLLAHGTDDQRRRWLPPLLRAQEIWCQLFSEPEAGSDLASLRTRAEAVDGGWRLHGQKVWTSFAAWAKWGICLARTDTAAPKHGGISYLVVDMEADGIEVRPLRQITGDAEFNEVFLDGTFVPTDHLVGSLHDGWRVASTTLAHERGTQFPFKEQVVHETYLARLLETAVADGHFSEPEIEDGLADAFVRLRLLRLHNWRTLSKLAVGGDIGAESSWIKLCWSDMTQHLSSLALEIVGDAAPLWQGAARNHDDGEWQHQWLWSKAASIAGGTSEVQRNIVGERLLGLPR